MSALLEIRDLGFAWPGQPLLFSGLSASLRPGLCIVTGDEQTGKTTLLRLLAGELAPTAGSVTLGGQPVTPVCAGWRRDMLAPALEAVSVADWLRQEVSDPEARVRLDEHIDGLSLGDHLHKTFHMLSAGSRRKAGLAAAMALRSPVSLLDQPFSALDLASIRHVHEWLAVEAGASDRLVILADYEAPDGLPAAQRLHLG